MAPIDAQNAADYDDRTTEAARSVLFEIGQILGSYHGKFAVIGWAVPWLLLEDAEIPHVGTADADLSLDPEALGDGECAQLVESLQRMHLAGSGLGWEHETPCLGASLTMEASLIAGSDSLPV